MAMGLAVTWCDTPRRLMGRAALHQQGPNEVRHRFSPRDHDNVKVPQRAICENDGGRTSPAQLMDQPGIKPSKQPLGWLWEEKKSGTNTINRPSVDHEKDTPSSSSPVLFGHTPTGQHKSDGRHRRRPCRTQCTGTCFYYYRSGGSHAPEHRACFTGRAFDWWRRGKLQKGCSGIWFTGFLLHCNEE